MLLLQKHLIPGILLRCSGRFCCPEESPNALQIQGTRDTSARESVKSPPHPPPPPRRKPRFLMQSLAAPSISGARIPREATPTRPSSSWCLDAKEYYRTTDSHCETMSPAIFQLRWTFLRSFRRPRRAQELISRNNCSFAPCQDESLGHAVAGHEEGSGLPISLLH